MLAGNEGNDHSDLQARATNLQHDSDRGTDAGQDRIAIEQGAGSLGKPGWRTRRIASQQQMSAGSRSQPRETSTHYIVFIHRLRMGNQANSSKAPDNFPSALIGHATGSSYPHIPGSYPTPQTLSDPYRSRFTMQPLPKLIPQDEPLAFTAELIARLP